MDDVWQEPGQNTRVTMGHWPQPSGARALQGSAALALSPSADTHWLPRGSSENENLQRDKAVLRVILS